MPAPRPAPLAPGDEIPSNLRPGLSRGRRLAEPADARHGHRAGQANRVRAVMSAIDSYAKRLAPPGSLIGISTIHFVRWLVIDDGRRLMMVSDYDGSWENYIDEFAEMILSGLDAIWETALGYPPDGARDLPAFKRFLRSHQVPAEVFFSAYPSETVLNIVNDSRALAAGAGDVGCRDDGDGRASADDAPQRHPGVHHERLRPSARRRVSVRPHRRSGRRPRRWIGGYRRDDRDRRAVAARRGRRERSSLPAP